MKIVEIENPITPEIAARLAEVFVDAFDVSPSDRFLERLNEKRDLSVLVAEEKGELLGFIHIHIHANPGD